MRFEVSSNSDVKCVGCGGLTRVVTGKIYNTDDLACNCIPPSAATKFEKQAEVKSQGFKMFATWVRGLFK